MGEFAGVCVCVCAHVFVCKCVIERQTYSLVLAFHTKLLIYMLILHRYGISHLKCSGY